MAKDTLSPQAPLQPPHTPPPHFIPFPLVSLPCPFPLWCPFPYLPGFFHAFAQKN